jgi:cytochrome P450
VMTFDEAFFGPECSGNPIAVLADLREHASMHYSEHLRGWAALGYDDARAILRSRGVGQGNRLGAYVANLPEDAARRLHPLSDYMDRAISFLDPPEHSAQRSAAAMVLDAGLGRRIEPAVHEVVQQRLDVLAQRTYFDGIEDFALPVTVAMICAILGIRYEDRDDFVGWVERVFAYLGSPMDDPELAADCKDAYTRMAAYVGRLLDEAKTLDTLETGSLIELLVAPSASHGRTDRDIMGMLVGMVQGGFETTTSLVSNAIAMLLQHPDQLDLLQGNPDLLPTAIEEVLRLAPSLKFVTRQALVDLNLRTQRIEGGMKVTAVILAANRDPAVFSNPDRFDISRNPNPHLSFGFGTHFCLGAPLARMQAQIAVAGVFARFPELRLGVDQLRWRPSALLRRLESLPLVVHSMAA